MNRMLTTLVLILTVCAVAIHARAQKPPSTSGQPATVRVVTLTGTDDMKYSPNTITAKPGERLRITLTTVSTMPKIAMAHNVVMLTPGADETAFVNASATARTTDFIAPHLKDQVLVASGLAGGGETVSVDVTAPATPGRYTFFCSFPGHYVAGMKGVLIVEAGGTR